MCYYNKKNSHRLVRTIYSLVHVRFKLLWFELTINKYRMKVYKANTHCTYYVLLIRILLLFYFITLFCHSFMFNPMVRSVSLLLGTVFWYKKYYNRFVYTLWLIVFTIICVTVQNYLCYCAIVSIFTVSVVFLMLLTDICVMELMLIFDLLLCIYTNIL